MKLLVIGFGQCGSNIADVFARINRRAQRQRGIEIVTGAYAVNTDMGDLTGLTDIRPDYHHRILIGGQKTSGHGVGKLNALGAEIAREDASQIIDAIRRTPQLPETDAFLLAAGAAGGTGSGAIPIMTQIIKERFRDKPVYNLIVLPFKHEEDTEQLTIYNSATCLKSASMVADAIFLVDNERYAKKNAIVRNNMAQINALVVESFYNILCAGEEKKAKYIGARLLDTGDIKESIAGWTAVGYGMSRLPLFRLPFAKSDTVKDKDKQTHRGAEAMEQAIGGLSFECNPKDAVRAVYLICAPNKEMNMTVVQEVGANLRGIATNAVIRYGDYPRGRGALEVSVMLSELTHVEKVQRYYDSTQRVVSTMKKSQEQTDTLLKKIDDSTEDIPSLL